MCYKANAIGLPEKIHSNDQLKRNENTRQIILLAKIKWNYEIVSKFFRKRKHISSKQFTIHKSLIYIYYYTEQHKSRVKEIRKSDDTNIRYARNTEKNYRSDQGNCSPLRK